jgi:iron complex outermembrane receptor protein
VDRFNCPTGASCPSLDGQPLPFAPDWKGAIRANYWMPVMDGLRVELGADYTWQSQTQYDLSTSANTIQPRYSIYNASIALSNPEKGWRFALVGKNLGDEHYSSQLLPGANTQRVVPRDNERFFGVNGRYEF